MTNKPDQTGKQPPPDAQHARADTLLPDDGQSGDGRFEVAEEVSLDQQSDTARKVGEAAAGAAADAVAESLRGKQTDAASAPRKP